MNLRRLRRLAGLTESFRHDPQIARAVEQRLATLPGYQHRVWRDLLDSLYDVGERGIDPADLSRQMRRQVNGDDWPLAQEAIETVASLSRFGEWVREDHHGWLFWPHAARSAEPSAPPLAQPLSDRPAPAFGQTMQLFRDLEAGARSLK